MKIQIESIPHKSQRYPTCGDWFFDAEGNLNIKVSQLGDWRHEFLVGIHELVEAVLCEYAGVNQKDVDAFDIGFEEKRSKSIVVDTREPGDEPSAPYYRQHFTATNIERILSDALRVDWHEYDKEINSLV